METRAAYIVARRDSMERDTPLGIIFMVLFGIQYCLGWKLKFKNR